jgi:phosphinothricin acetyltransferase
MKEELMVTIRHAEATDIPRLTELYNYDVTNTFVTFDPEPVSIENRQEWFSKYSKNGPHQVLVAEQGSIVLGCASSSRYREHIAFRETIEVGIYVANETRGQGIGTLLYSRLFEILKSERVHLAVAGIALPNPASIALHKKFGFTEVGIFKEYAIKKDQYISSIWLQKLLN